MNKKELKEIIRNIYWKPKREEMLELIDQLDDADEAYKSGYDTGKMHADKKLILTVPVFVADWFEEHKANLERSIYEKHKRIACNELFVDDSFHKWFTDPTNRPIETLIRMKDGYRVEEEKYRARLKLIGDWIASYLASQSSDPNTRLDNLEINSYYIAEDYRHLSEFTQKELEQLGIWDSDQWDIEGVDQ